MDNLSAIVNSLSPGEEKLVRHFYEYRNFGEYRKRATLFDLLCKRKPLDEGQVARLLGYASANSSFTNLKARLRSDVLNILLMQEGATKFSTPYAQALFECRRSLMQGEILIGRGVYDEALDILERAAKTAQKFEFFAELVQIEDLVRNHRMMHESNDLFKERSDSIDRNYKRLGEMLQAKQAHYEITMPELLGVNSYEEYCVKGFTTVTRLLESSARSCSSRSEFYTRLTALNYFSAVHDFDSALKQAEALLESVENDPVVMSGTNQAGVHMELANIYLNTADYEKAIRHASRAVELFKPGMLNHLHAYIILFFSYFRNKDYAKAAEVLDIATEHRVIRSQQQPMMALRLQLLRAGLAFTNGDYDSTSNLLRESTDLLKDKEGWMPGYFLLESLVLIEKKSIEVAIYKIEAFRKMLYRAGRDKDEFRLGVITRLLKQIVRDNCDYEKIFRRQNNEIRTLSEAKAHFYWDPAGYEIIRFDEWLLKKVS